MQARVSWTPFTFARPLIPGIILSRPNRFAMSVVPNTQVVPELRLQCIL